MVGDGSGSRWGYPGGWAAIVFDKNTGLRKTLYGSLSDTTVNICELSPFLYAMQWYARGPGKALQNMIRRIETYARPINVYLVTDCEIIANQGNKKMAREANAALWAGMDYFAKLNYNLHYRWFARETFVSNILCDNLSKDMRHLITSIENRQAEMILPDAYNDRSATPAQED